MSKRKKALGAVHERGVVPDLSGPPRCAPLYTTTLPLRVEREPVVDPTGGAARCADGAGRGMEREEFDAHAPEHAYCEVRDKDKAADGDETQPLLKVVVASRGPAVLPRIGFHVLASVARFTCSRPRRASLSGQRRCG